MARHLLFSLILSFLFNSILAQCPLVYNSQSTPTSNPLFVNCNGSVYNLNFIASSSFGTYTINWGDGGPITTGSSYTANTAISHTYAATTNTYILTLTTSTCVITGTVVQEQAALASIIVPGGVGSTLCAPKTLTFTNGTTFTSATTNYTWNFGDQLTTPEVHTYTNSGQNVTHLYQKGSVNCVTTVSLMAQNYCNFSPSIASFGPLQVYDIDDAQISADKVIRCWPDNTFQFSNTTARNCVPQGNTTQRYERWNFGNYWGVGHDSIKGWDPWPPSIPVSISYTSVGLYNLSLIDSSLCGVDTALFSVFIVNSPTAGVIVPAGSICQNSPVTFTNSSAAGYSYRWNFGAGGGFVNLGSGNKTFTYTTPGTYTVQVIALIPGAGGACSDTARAVINVQPIPVSGFTMSPSAGCGSLSVSFTNLSTGAVSWAWSFGNGNSSTLQIPSPETYTLSGISVASLVVTASTGCTHSSTGTVTIRPKPVPSIALVVACEDSPITFTNTSTVSGTNAITGYTWSFGDGSAASTLTNPVHTYSAAGSPTVKLIATTAFCSDSISQVITINVKPTASFVITPTIACPPFTANLTNLSQNASQFLWRFGTSPTATSSSTGALFTYTNGTQSMLTHTVTLIATSAAGCTDSMQLTVSVRPKPVAGFTTNTITDCSPMLTTFTSTSTGATSHSWLFGDGGTSSAQNPTHTYTNTSLFTQTVITRLIVTNSVSCSDTTDQLMTIYAEALPNFSIVPVAGCSPLTVNFPGVPGVATYTWNHGDGSPPLFATTSHTWTYTNTGLSDQVFTVSLDAHTSNGCPGSSSSTLITYHRPVASFSIVPLAGCSPLTANFNSDSQGTISATQWTFGNGSVSTLSNTSSTFTNATGSPTLSYNVKLLVTTINGCKDSIVKPIIMFPQPRAGFSPDTPSCTPKNMKLKNTSSGANSFRWNFGDGGSSTQDTAVHLYVNNDLVAKTFFTKLTAFNANGCRDSLTIPILIHSKPNYAISALPESGCSPLTVRFPAIGGVKEYEWRYDKISFGSTADASNIFKNETGSTKTFTVEMIGKDAFKCSDTAVKLIQVYPQPVARFSAKPLSVFIPDQEVLFTNESSSNSATFTWDFGDNTTSKEKNPKHAYKEAGEYEVVLIAATSLGCKDTFALPEQVVALQETTIEMPNAFTPNTAGSPGTIFDPQDLSNDIFHPNVRGADKYVFSIYSRWGELLFETKDPAEGWDGYYKGKLCTPDVYVWKVSATFVDGKSFNETGDVLLIR